VDLSIKIIQESEEYQVIIEGDGLTRIIKARTIDELIKSLNNEIRELLTAREDTESLKASPCVLRGWYIRLPIMKLLDIVAYLVKNNQGDPTDNLMRYLDTHGLSRSNYRVIVPTLSALGLWRQGGLTREAEELGKAVMEGSSELPSLLYRLAIRNCVLKDAIDKLAEGVPMDDVVKSMGLTRRDEINYTNNLLEIIMGSDEFKCLRYSKALSNYLRNGGCFTDSELPRNCVLEQVITVFNYLVSNRSFHMAGLLSDVDVTVNLNAITIQLNDNYALIMQGNKPIGVLMGDFITTSSNYAPKARETVDRLEPVAAKIMKINNLMLTVIIVPIIIKDGCSRMKVYVMVGNKTDDWVARVFDIP